MKKVKLYADGSCHQRAKSSGRGGYAAILIFPEGEVTLSGKEEETTNNRMELFSIIVAMESLKEPHDVEIYSDSAYVVNCFLNKWYENWFKNGWHSSDGKPVKNKGLWVRLMKSLIGHKVKFNKVKGHSDDHYNNLCDCLAREASL